MVEAQVIEQVKEVFSRSMDMSRDYTDEEIFRLIETCVFEISRETYLSIPKKKAVVEAVFNAKRRLDVLQPLLDDMEVTEIMVNGPDRIFIEKRGRILPAKVKIENEEKLYHIIQSIVSKVNRTVNESSPIVDARLKDGSRVSAVLPPVALNGPILTIRKFPEKPYTMNELVKLGSLPEECACFLEKLVKAGYNIFISGGTGSGKTTYLNALSNFIPSHERIVTIEDSAELQLPGKDNLVRMETRNANTEGKGEIAIRDLIRASLRMRPDRIIVGEVRGAEALDMLQAMNTGHDGSLSTGHANSPRDMLIRLETMVLCAAVLPVEAIRQQIASALDILIHLGRLRDMSRRTLEISEVIGVENGNIRLNPLYSFSECEKQEEGYVAGALTGTGNGLVNTWKLKMAGVHL
jgi:pilus assembly protein CpaF